MFLLNSLVQSLASGQASFSPISNGLLGSTGPASAFVTGNIGNLTTALALGTIEIPLDRIAELIRALALGGV